MDTTDTKKYAYPKNFLIRSSKTWQYFEMYYNKTDHTNSRS